MLFLWILLAVSTASAQRIFDGGIVSAANFEPGVSSQQIASLFGENLATRQCTAQTTPLPRSLCDVTVEMSDDAGNRVSAPLFFVSPNQINLQIPTALGAINVCVGGSCQRLFVDVQTPGIFEYQRLPGVWEPLITHADGKVVTPTNPAENGETLILYATGMSLAFRTLDYPADGEAAPLNRLIRYGGARWIRVAGFIVPVDFAGLAPGFVGLSQFNFQLRVDGPAGVQPFPSGQVPVWIEDVGVSKRVMLWVR